MSSPEDDRTELAYTVTDGHFDSFIDWVRDTNHRLICNPDYASQAAYIRQAASVADMEARYAKSPLVLLELAGHDLTAEDAVLLPIVFMNASINAEWPTMAKDYPATPDQIAFYRAHADQFRGINALTL